MSAFNMVTAAAPCPSCGQIAEFEVQFKYGDTWQHLYRIGDRLRWGGNDIGSPGHMRVLVEGIGGPCPHCGTDNMDFDLVVQNDAVVRLEPVRGERSISGPEGFVVVER
jgi:hypothetical protein